MFWCRWCQPPEPAWRPICAVHSAGGQRMPPSWRGFQGGRRSGRLVLPRAWPWRSQQPAQRGCAAPLAAWNCNRGGMEPEVWVGGAWPKWRGGIGLDDWTPYPRLVRAMTSWTGRSQGKLDKAPTGGKSCRLRMSNLLSSGRSGGGGWGDGWAPAQRPCAPLTRIPQAWVELSSQEPPLHPPGWSTATLWD